jgi:uncharacterized protein YdaU (DUF1376 family)
MSELPYLPLWTSKYLGATTHLNYRQHGVYIMLLIQCWRQSDCSIPNDADWIQTRLRMTAKQYQTDAAPVVAEFFEKNAHGRLHQPRLTIEFHQVISKKVRRRETGREGGLARARKNTPPESEQKQGSEPSNAIAMLKQPSSIPYSYTETDTEIEKEEPKGSSKKKVSSTRGTRLPEAWTLPTEWADEAYQYRTPNGEYLTAEEVNHEADKFRDHWIAQGGSRGVKVDWRATWRNWIRNGSGQIIRNRNASRNGRSGSGGQHERPSLAAAFMRAGGLLENPDDVPRGPQNGRLDLEGRFHRGEVVPFGGAARPAIG